MDEHPINFRLVVRLEVGIHEGIVDAGIIHDFGSTGTNSERPTSLPVCDAIAAVIGDARKRKRRTNNGSAIGGTAEQQLMNMIDDTTDQKTRKDSRI